MTFLGSNERIVQINRVHKRMATWKGGKLQVMEGAEHEILMEKPQIRDAAIEDITRLFLGNVRK